MEPIKVFGQAKAVWELSRTNLHLWIEALGRPRNLLVRWDRERSDALEKAAEYSVFPVVLSMLIDIPFFIAYVPSTYGPASLAASYLVLIYVQAAIWAGFLFFVGRLLFGKASLKQCLAAVLVFTTFWPINEMLSYLFKIDKALLCPRLTGTILGDQWNRVTHNYNYWTWFILSNAYAVAFCLLIIPAIKYIHRVGTVRAVFICILFGFGGLVASDGMIKPVLAKMFNACPDAAESRHSALGRVRDGSAADRLS